MLPSAQFEARVLTLIGVTSPRERGTIPVDDRDSIDKFIDPKANLANLRQLGVDGRVFDTRKVCVVLVTYIITVQIVRLDDSLPRKLVFLVLLARRQFHFLDVVENVDGVSNHHSHQLEIEFALLKLGPL